MQFPTLSPRIIVALLAVSLFVAREGRTQEYEPAGLRVPSTQSDLFEASLGFNYIYLDRAYPETKNLYGVDASLFVNATSWLGVGGDFMANFGSHSVPFFFGNSVDVDSQRYFYVFGPRVTVWHNPQFRVFAEALAGGVHAEAQATATSRFSSRTVSASEDAFAMSLGAGFDWRFTEHLSWRVVQADYLPTSLGSDWQNNFRASTGIVYSFGRR
jgi:opacity protein-like surface antigen